MTFNHVHAAFTAANVELTQLDRIEALLERIAENTTDRTVTISDDSMANLGRVASGLPARLS